MTQYDDILKGHLRNLNKEFGKNGSERASKTTTEQTFGVSIIEKSKESEMEGVQIALQE